MHRKVQHQQTLGAAEVGGKIGSITYYAPAYKRHQQLVGTAMVAAFLMVVVLLPRGGHTPSQQEGQTVTQVAVTGVPFVPGSKPVGAKSLVGSRGVRARPQTQESAPHTEDADTGLLPDKASHADGGTSISALSEQFPLLKLCSVSSSAGGPKVTWDDVRTLVAADHEPFSAGDIKRHLDRIMGLLDDSDAMACYQKITAALQSQSVGVTPKAFFDLGSREIDSTTTFLKRYPTAKDFEVHCFEANPKFNELYVPFSKLHPNVHYHNFAVGVENTTLFLSNRDVGSSVLDAKAKSAVGRQQDGVSVPVIHFSDFLANRVGAIRPGTFAVVKMDIEKMEYAVLHQMLRTGTVTMFREFLMECHYNTNWPREKRNATIHIGKDDCVRLVEALRRIGAPSAGLPPAQRSGWEAPGATTGLEVVLWNSPKTARATGSRYMERHGGFFPT
jgi:FkbM family methyltransferase